MKGLTADRSKRISSFGVADPSESAPRYNHSGGGFVFAIGSVEAGRVAVNDANITGVMKNMLTNAGVPGEDWKPHARDFNDDGYADILWYNVDHYGRSVGQCVMWYGTSGGGFTVQTNVGSEDGYYIGWIPYVGAFNGDGKSDILWDNADTYGNSDGQRIFWKNNGSGSYTITFNAAGSDGGFSGWRLFVTDVNHDGKSDLVWILCNNYGSRSYGITEYWTGGTSGLTNQLVY